MNKGSTQVLVRNIIQTNVLQRRPEGWELVPAFLKRDGYLNEFLKSDESHRNFVRLSCEHVLKTFCDISPFMSLQSPE